MSKILLVKIETCHDCIYNLSNYKCTHPKAPNTLAFHYNDRVQAWDLQSKRDPNVIPDWCPLENALTKEEPKDLANGIIKEVDNE